MGFTLSDAQLTCPLRFQAKESPVRRGEPVTVGLPWPQGAIADERLFELVAPDGSRQTLQSKVLDRWSDGSIRWCLFDFLATVAPGEKDYSLRVNSRREPGGNQPNSSGPSTGRFANVQTTVEPNAIIIADSSDADGAQLRIEFPDGFVSALSTGAAESSNSDDAVSPIRRTTHPGVFRLQPASTSQSFELALSIETFANLNSWKVTATVTNRNPAGHPNGNWDLGNAGSIEFQGLLARVVSRQGDLGHTVRYSAERNQPFQTGAAVQLTQISSGGDHWQSTNHFDKNHNVTLPYRGYHLKSGEEITAGDRATPIVTVESEQSLVGITMPLFWENFPKEIQADRLGASLDLFPSETELQGGEQKTHTFFVSFGRDAITEQSMLWCRSPLLCHADPEWYAASGAVPYLTPREGDPHRTYLSLVDQAIEGADTFAAKREKIDEFGWRHFGDIYGDHEAVKQSGLVPLISHYNNQYDCVQGFLAQFLRSGDGRWWEEGLACADHTCDIDIYHTTGDKAAYNGGLFWHTYHYVDADTSTHRSYPRSLHRGPNVNQTERVEQLDETADKLQKAYAVGGGPSASHNYNVGLMTAYFLTGDTRYRETAIDLARFVVRMEDPSTTPFRYFSKQATGLATDSGGGGYHGPGRASANSINALVVGHRLTGDASLLAKAEQLIRRVCHPKQNLESLDLLNAELRWFYTMHLQALGNYLDHKVQIGQLDQAYAYARLTLLHYARWMAVHERPILDTPERLQFPTETWCAQDMRKVEVFQFAAKHARGPEREKFLERAGFFFQYVERTLPTFSTKSLCRPVVLMMKYGWSRNWWLQNPQASAPEPSVNVSPDQFGKWHMFIPQRALAVKRAKQIAVLGMLGCASVFVSVLIWVVKNYVWR
ncbi:MAG: hypothetical protein U0798_09120 [Gemmataceae bacterium]